MEPNIHEFISRFKDSGERSQMAFCKRHSISYHKFKYHWKRQQIKKAAPERSGFIGLKLDGPTSKVKPAEPIKETAYIYKNPNLVGYEWYNIWGRHCI